MSIQEQIDALRISIRGLPSRKDMSDLLDILVGMTTQEKHPYIVNFLDFYPTVKDKILNDLNSYPNYAI